MANSDTNNTDRKLRYNMYFAACLRAARPESRLDRVRVRIGCGLELRYKMYLAACLRAARPEIRCIGWRLIYLYGGLMYMEG